MHKIEISPTTMGRVRALRGRTHMFNHLDPARTAHIIVDLQNGFMEPGAAVEIPQAREIVPNVNRISAAVRAAGGLNVFIRYLVNDTALALLTVEYFQQRCSDLCRQPLQIKVFKYGAQMFVGATRHLTGLT